VKFQKSDGGMSRDIPNFKCEFLTLVRKQAHTHRYYVKLFHSVNKMNQLVFKILLPWCWWNSFHSLEQLLLLTVFFLFQVLHTARFLISVVWAGLQIILDTEKEFKQDIF